MSEALFFFEKAIELDNKNIKFSTTLLGSSHFLEHNVSYYKKYSKIFRDNILKYSSSEISKFRYPKKNPLKIGILSRGLRKYPTGYFLLDLINNLYKEKSLELYAFYDFDYEDQYTKQIKKNFYSWDDVSSLTDLELINLIRNKGINILIDMQGHTYANRLQIFANKPAPIQVSWAAYLASTGIPEIDYIIGDPVVTPSIHQNIYAEKIYQLPNIWCPLSTSDINQIYLKQKTTTQDIIFGCFNNIKKINNNLISAWSKILLNLPRSKLYIKSDEFKNNKFKEYFENKFGVLKNQLILEEQSSREKLLECYNNIDIALDTFPYSGGTTNLELSFMCVPLITMSGDTFLSRCGASVNKNLNMKELIAYSFDEYVEIATNLAKDQKKLNFIKLELLKNSRKSNLFNIEAFSKDFTIAMHDMWTVFLNQNNDINK
jgi:predicted O-linked N-acetylglucosamine transferase (SPINDLY family)